MCLDLFSTKPIKDEINAKHLNIESIIRYLKTLNIGELLAMHDFVDQISKSKEKERQQTEELKRKLAEKKKILEEKKRLLEEMRKQNLVQTYMRDHFGKTSLMSDFFVNRML
jgi:hypothetical protein